MHKLRYLLAGLAALVWSSAAWAVLQETTVTLTDSGEPLPEATITLNRITDSEPPPETKTEKTDESGKIVIIHEEEDNASDSTIEIIVRKSDGKTLTRRVVLKEFLVSETIDVAAPSDVEHASTQSQRGNECPDLTNLDDPQLEIIIKDPAVRQRIVKLIEETERAEETEQTEEADEVQDGGQLPGKKTVSKKGKETKKVVRKKSDKKEASQKTKKNGSAARELLGTGVSIGLGIAGGSRGKRDHGMRGHSRGMD
jgi:hypothetical protein